MYSNIFKKNIRIISFGYNDESLKKWEREISEYRNEEKIIYLEGTPEDYILLKKKGLFLLARHMQISVMEDVDFEYLRNNIRLSEIKIPLKLSKHILVSKGIPPHSYELELSNINELNIEQLEYLSKNGRKIENIILTGFTDSTFKVEDFLKLKKTLNNITMDIDKNNSDIQKFLRVYKILGENLTYKKHSRFREAIYNKEASCQGYSELLKLALNNVGVDCNIIIGSYKEPGDPEFDGHDWNQVKIEGKWYNCDLTWDSPKIKEGKKLKYCLRNDSVFQNENEHVPSRDNKEIHKVQVEYNQSIINQYFDKYREEER